MEELQFVALSEANISQDVLLKFDCTHPDFNDYLKEDALSDSSDGRGVTYILVDTKEYLCEEISTIFAFATIQTSALFYPDSENNQEVCSISCAEIKYFAIDRKYQNQTAFGIDSNKHYSTIFFECLLSDLYVLSTSVIGFQAIFLRANDMGYSLYKRKKFVDASDYMIPFEESDPLGKCTPMVLMIQNNVYSIFGIE